MSRTQANPMIVVALVLVITLRPGCILPQPGPSSSLQSSAVQQQKARQTLSLFSGNSQNSMVS